MMCKKRIFILFVLVPTCQFSFEPVVSYTTVSGDQSQSIAIGDLNNDDHLDIAVVNGQSMNVDVLFGIGDGTFLEHKTYSNETISPKSIVAGDFNSDSCMDLALANQDYDSISVLLGNCIQAVLQRIVLFTGLNTQPNLLLTTDFNNDDDLDLVVVYSYPYGLGIFLGIGDGTFQTQTTYCSDICEDISSVAVGDFNEDGHLDLVFTDNFHLGHYSPDHVYILLNDGNGYFGEPVEVFAELYSHPTSVAVGDFNNDNQLDLAITNANKNNIGIMLGDGNGNFQAQVKFSTAEYSAPNSVVIGDFNNDGQLDLAVCNRFAHNLGLLFSLGNGTFLSQITFSTGAHSIPTAIVSADLNNDGQLDLIITDDESNTVGILLNTCDCCIPKL